MDHERIASDILRALRGRRSQPAFSKRLGYRSNVVYRWESGKTFPTAARAIGAAVRVGVDVRGGFRRFFRGTPDWLEQVEPASPNGVAELLRHLVGITPIGEVARRAKRSRFAVARWLKGEAEPRLPELLLMVDVASQRLLDFIAVFVDPAKLPSVADAWSELEAAREAAYSSPWSHAVVRALELADYKALPRHRPGWVAERLGLSLDEEERALELLAQSRQIRQAEGRWVVAEDDRAVDTRADPARSRQVKQWWTERALQRIDEGHLHRSSYAVFSISERDLTEAANLHREFYDRLRALVTQSTPSERIVLLVTHFVDLEVPSGSGPAELTRTRSGSGRSGAKRAARVG